MRFISNSWYNSLNWLYLYHADAFFQFRGLIRILDVISIPIIPVIQVFNKIEYFTLMERGRETQFKLVV